MFLIMFWKLGKSSWSTWKKGHQNFQKWDKIRSKKGAKVKNFQIIFHPTYHGADIFYDIASKIKAAK